MKKKIRIVVMIIAVMIISTQNQSIFAQNKGKNKNTNQQGIVRDSSYYFISWYYKTDVGLLAKNAVVKGPNKLSPSEVVELSIANPPILLITCIKIGKVYNEYQKGGFNAELPKGKKAISWEIYYSTLSYYGPMKQDRIKVTTTDPQFSIKELEEFIKKERKIDEDKVVITNFYKLE